MYIFLYMILFPLFYVLRAEPNSVPNSVVLEMGDVN